MSLKDTYNKYSKGILRAGSFLAPLAIIGVTVGDWYAGALAGIASAFFTVSMEADQLDNPRPPRPSEFHGPKI